MDRELIIESNVWSTGQNRKRADDMMMTLDLNETIDQLAVTDSVCWYGHVLRMDDGHVLRKQ